MQTIIIVLHPEKLKNPDLDLRYCIPDRLEEVSGGMIQDNGYDYIDTEEGQPGPPLGLWLETESASQSWPTVLSLFQQEKFKGNDLSLSAEIFISENDTADLKDCTLVYPEHNAQEEHRE